MRSGWMTALSVTHSDDAAAVCGLQPYKLISALPLLKY